MRDTILILKNQQATSTIATSWKSNLQKTVLLNKFVQQEIELTELE